MSRGARWAGQRSAGGLGDDEAKVPGCSPSTSTHPSMASQGDAVRTCVFMAFCPACRPTPAASHWAGLGLPGARAMSHGHGGLHQPSPAHTVKISRHLKTKTSTTFSSEENDDKPSSVDDTFVICDDRFVT